MPIFCVKSLKIYTGQKNLHWRHQWRQWQLSGMLFISSTGQNYLWPWYLTPIPCLFFFLCRKNTYFFSNIFLFFLFPFVSFLRDIEYDLPITPVILYHINFHMRNFLAQFGLVYAFLPSIVCHCLSLLNVLKISQKWETFSNFFFKKASS